VGYSYIRVRKKLHRESAKLVSGMRFDDDELVLEGASRVYNLDREKAFIGTRKSEESLTAG